MLCREVIAGLIGTVVVWMGLYGLTVTWREWVQGGVIVLFTKVDSKISDWTTLGLDLVLLVELGELKT